MQLLSSTQFVLVRFRTLILKTSWYPSDHSKDTVSIWLVVWLPFFIFPYIGNVIIPIDFHIFQRGSNHQPAIVSWAFHFVTFEMDHRPQPLCVVLLQHQSTATSDLGLASGLVFMQHDFTKTAVDSVIHQIIHRILYLDNFDTQLAYESPMQIWKFAEMGYQQIIPKNVDG